MSFWSIVLVALIGAPMALMMVVMMTIFGAAGLANANRDALSYVATAIGLLACGALAAAFGAFGVVPAWRAWHGGAENFVGWTTSFVHWLIGAAVIAGICFARWTVESRAHVDIGANKAPVVAMGWLVTGVNLLCFGAIVAWGLVPLVLWAIRGRLVWPDQVSGWTHALEVAAGLLVLGLIEGAVRKGRGR